MRLRFSYAKSKPDPESPQVLRKTLYNGLGLRV